VSVIDIKTGVYDEKMADIWLVDTTDGFAEFEPIISG
jgi:hypothetical protein